MKGRDGLEASDDWQTPQYIFQHLNKEFNFDYDPTPFQADFDGLKLERWGNMNFVNPEYNRIVKPLFIDKAVEQWRRGQTSVLLIPANTDTRDFHNKIWGNAEIRLIKNRVAFLGFNTKGSWKTKNKGKSGSMLCIFHAGMKCEKVSTVEYVWDDLGPMKFTPSFIP